MNKNKKSLKINFIYKFIILCLNMVYPLITAPYVSRVLGANNLGKFNFAQATVNFIIVLAGLGVSTYGIREVSKVAEDKEKLSKVTSELLCLLAIAALIFSFIYLIIISKMEIFNNDFILFFIFGLNLVFSFLSLDWFYSGMEEFKYITNRNIIVKIVGLLLLFIFVRNRNDYINYAIIFVTTSIIVNIYSLININKYIKITFKNLDLKKHLVNTRFFYLTLLMGSIYGILDQVLVGILTDPTSLALYTRARQIGQLVVQITAAISLVMLPRLSHIYNDSKVEYLKMIKKSYRIIIMIALPIMVGLIFISKDVMYLLGGNEFVLGYKSLDIIAVWTFFVSIAVFTDNQVLIPLGKEKYTTSACIIVAIVSLVSNLIFIPHLGYIGSSITLLVADFTGMAFQIYYVKKMINFNFIDSYFIKYIFSCFIMIIFLVLINNTISNLFIRLVIGSFLSIVIYFSLLYIIKDNIVIEQVNNLYNKIIKNKKVKDER